MNGSRLDSDHWTASLVRRICTSQIIWTIRGKMCTINANKFLLPGTVSALDCSDFMRAATAPNCTLTSGRSQLWGRKWCTLDLNELCQPTPWTGRSSDREDGRDFLCEKLFCCQESASSLLSVWNRFQVSQRFQTGVALWIEKQHISRSYYHGSEKSARPRKARSHLSVLFGRCPARAPEQLL